MVGGFKKKQSKRISTRKRTKIERKVKEHHRKVRKEAKKSTSIHKAKRKDPGVPNSLPFKEEILQEAEARKQRLAEERLAQKEKAKKEREKMKNKARNLQQLVAETKKKTDDFNKKNHIKEGQDKVTTEKSEGSLKAYYKEFKKVVQAADVVLEILDARDPLGSRCPQVEEAVLAARPMKRLVLVLNKIDLIPKENAEAWLKYLRNEFPTVIFKASTQSQTDNLSQVALKGKAAPSADMLKSSKCLGADMLMTLLASYGQNQSVRKAIAVGVVGFPNTGKSSIINSLKRSKVCNVGSTPGVTKEMQEIKIDKNVKLLDSPGIVMASGQTDAQLILRNCMRVESIEDPTAPVSSILSRCPKESMMLHYNITEYADVTEFLALIARRYGQLRKGGVPDTVRAARTVLHDWNNGRITYFTHPPETQSAQLSAEIKSEMSAGFDIDALVSSEESVLSTLRSKKCTDMIVESQGPTNAVSEADAEAEMKEDEDDEEEEWESEDEEEMSEGGSDIENEGELAGVTVEAGQSKKKKSAENHAPVPSKPKDKYKKMDKVSKNVANTVNAKQGLVKLNLERKKQYKKAQKEQRRADARGDELGKQLAAAFEGVGTKDTAAYSFETDLTI